jgi:hypothetical protein
MSEQQIHEIEINMEQAKSFIGMGEALDKLHKNRDFKKIIVEGYFKEEAIRLVNLKSEPAMQSPEKQASIIRDIDAIGSLRSYFGKLYMQADQAIEAVKAGEEAIEEIRNEGI